MRIEEFEASLAAMDRWCHERSSEQSLSYFDLYENEREFPAVAAVCPSHYEMEPTVAGRTQKLFGYWLFEDAADADAYVADLQASGGFERRYQLPYPRWDHPEFEDIEKDVRHDAKRTDILKNWLGQNCKGRYRVTSANFVYQVVFEQLTDATYYKMFWL